MNPSFENLVFNPINLETVSLNADVDPDENLLKDSLADLNTKYFCPENVLDLLKNTDKKAFSVLHLNIRSLQKHFDNFKSFVSELNFSFKIICLSETWLVDSKNAPNFNLTNYQMIHLNRNNGRIGGGVCIYIHESIAFKERKDLSISNNESEVLSIEIINTTKNVVLSSVYRPPDSSIKEFKTSLKPIFDDIQKSNKDLYLVGDFNINVLDYQNNTKVKDFVNFSFQNSLIPLINKPTRVTRTSATAIDHIITNAFINKTIETGIIKADISDHFPIFLITDPVTLNGTENKKTIYKRTINTETKENFKNILERQDWGYIKNIDNPNEAYSKFLYDFSLLYEEAYPKQEIKIKQKNLISPWITKGLIKSSKQKQRLYIKFLKSRTKENETNYKTYKNLFEILKKKSKKNYYSELLAKYKNDAKILGK